MTKNKYSLFLGCISKNLRYLRLDGVFRFRDVSEKTGISITSLFNYENGISAPSKEKAETLAAFYGINPDRLTMEPDGFKDWYEENKK